MGLPWDLAAACLATTAALSLSLWQVIRAELPTWLRVASVLARAGPEVSGWARLSEEQVTLPRPR